MERLVWGIDSEVAEKDVVLWSTKMGMKWEGTGESMDHAEPKL